MTASMQEPRRREIAIHSRSGAGTIAGLEFGPADRPLDILFLHANGFNAMTYRQLFLPMADELRILAVDHRGHGLSRLPTVEEGHSWQTYSNDLLALIEALGEVPAVLSGHSMGGTTILLTAPRLAAGAEPSIVLFDPVIMSRAMLAEFQGSPRWDSPLAAGALRRNAIFGSRPLALESYRGRGAFKTWPDPVLRDYLTDGLKEREDGQFELTCAPRWEAANFAMSANDVSGSLLHPRGPIRILKAEVGSTCNTDERASEYVASGRVRIDVIPGTTHFVPMERPELAREALREALEARAQA